MIMIFTPKAAAFGVFFTDIHGERTFALWCLFVSPI